MHMVACLLFLSGRVGIEWRRKYDDAMSPLLLRCSVGLEEADHLRADLERAILAVNAA